jgi:hypothetical protein
MGTIRKTPVAARELGVSYHQLIGLVRFGKLDPPPGRDSSGDYLWTDGDMARAREAFAGVGRRKGAPACAAVSA